MAPNFPAVEITQVTHRRGVRTQPVSHYRLGLAVTLQRFLHKCQCRSFIAALGDEGLEDFTLVIDRAPQVVRLAVDLYVHLIKMPLPMPKNAYLADALAANIRREQRAKSVPPQPNRLMAKVDSAFEQQILDVPQLQR